jgi:protein-disulfide isomerase
MKRTMQVLLLAFMVPFLAVLAGCETTGGKSNQLAEPGSSRSDVVAVVAGEELTMGQIEDLAAGGLIQVRQQRYDMLRGALERLGVQKLMEAEAAERGITADELRLLEIDGKIQEPTESEMENAYRANVHRAGGLSYQELRSSIQSTIRRDRLNMRETRYVDELKKKYGFSVSLVAPRVEFELTSANPSRGNPDAPITLVEFGDYQCPYCRRAHTTVQRVLAEYGDKVRHVFMDFPLANHDRARPAAEAAYCAGEQGKYWDYSDHLMVMSGDLNDDNLRDRADQIGLDVDEFMSCFISGRHSDVVAAGLQTGASSGVDRTPTFFINGRLLTGAKNFETFQLIIDEELATIGG